MRVLDSSVAFKTVVREIGSDKATRLIEDFRKGIEQLIAPDIFPVEIGHALTRAERQGRISTAEGFRLWTQVMMDSPQLFPSLPLMSRAYAISSQNRIGIYDALLVSLADQERCEVVSADLRLIKLFPSQVIPLSSL
jgi:predicted nucleic acid-binding protein